jgi:hypothetical protein
MAAHGSATIARSRRKNVTFDAPVVSGRSLPAAFSLRT